MDPSLRPTSSPAVAAAIKPSFALRIGNDSLGDSSVVAISNKKSKKKKKTPPYINSEDVSNATTPTNKYAQTTSNHLDAATPTNPTSSPPHILNLVLPSDVCNISPASTDGICCHGDDVLLMGINPMFSFSPEENSSDSSPVGSIQSVASEDNLSLVNNILFDPQSALEATASVLKATEALPTSSVVTVTTIPYYLCSLLHL